MTSSGNNATMKEMRKVERNRNVFAVYIIDVSRDCFLCDVAIVLKDLPKCNLVISLSETLKFRQRKSAKEYERNMDGKLPPFN